MARAGDPISGLHCRTTLMARWQDATPDPYSRTSMPHGLLLITAHPDDESFFGAGTSARYTEAGVRVALVCAMLGQAGKAGDPPVAAPDELPRVRDRELREA